MKKLLSLLLVCGVPACSSAVDEESEGGSEEALRTGTNLGTTDPIYVEPVDPIDPPWTPPPPPKVCYTINPTCSKRAITDAAFTGPLEAAGCSETYHYYTGAGAGLLGGIVSYCKLGTALTRYMQTHRGILRTDICDRCLRGPSPGYAWVMWQAFVGPNCASGCRIARMW